MKNERQFSAIDQLCLGVDQCLRSIFGKPQATRKNPAANLAEAELSRAERKHIAGLMRVNHAGEVCAQALYHAQGYIARAEKVRIEMRAAAAEEGDHLAWCQERLVELGSHTSYLNPLWYAGSFMIGLSAGLMGDQWSLGFLAETENQVVQHLQKHSQNIPAKDSKTQTILQQMQIDEAQHRHHAIVSGANELPAGIKKLMSLTSKVMVKIAYWF